MALEAVYWMARSNVGRQQVVDCWSSDRERSSSELSTDARDGQQRSASRAHRSGRRHDGQHVMEIWRRRRRQHLVGQHRSLVRDAVFPAATATKSAAALRLCDHRAGRRRVATFKHEEVVACLFTERMPFDKMPDPLPGFRETKWEEQRDTRKRREKRCGSGDRMERVEKWKGKIDWLIDWGLTTLSEQ